MNNRADAPLHAALAAVWEQAMGVASAAVRPVGAVNVQRLAGLSPLTNERDFPVPGEPRPVRVAVYGNLVPRWRGKTFHQLT